MRDLVSLDPSHTMHSIHPGIHHFLPAAVQHHLWKCVSLLSPCLQSLQRLQTRKPKCSATSWVLFIAPKALCNCRSWAGLGCRLLFHGRQMSTAVILSRFLPHEDFVSLHEIQAWLLSVSSQSLAGACVPPPSLPSFSLWVVEG